jgi:hypothetical protein
VNLSPVLARPHPSSFGAFRGLSIRHGKRLAAKDARRTETDSAFCPAQLLFLPVTLAGTSCDTLFFRPARFDSPISIEKTLGSKSDDEHAVVSIVG